MGSFFASESVSYLCSFFYGFTMTSNLYHVIRLINKLRAGSIVRPDAREERIVRMSNITKFLAACSSYGLPDEDLFQQDDIIEGTGECLARVATTIIALIKLAEFPAVERSKIITGQGKKMDVGIISGPYALGGSSSYASASSPNLSHSRASPLNSPVRKRYSPPTCLPPVRSDSSDPVKTSLDETAANGHDLDVQNMNDIHTPFILAPPPRSPLRIRIQKRYDDRDPFTLENTSTSPPRSSVADSTHASIGDVSITEFHNGRQSMASSMTTDVSSILDFGRTRTSSSGYNKFGTIRTVTTDMTSEAPSMTRTEGSAIADELTHRKSTDGGAKYSRDRKVSEGPIVDLTRVVEEVDESTSSSRSGGKYRGKRKVAEQEPVVSKPGKTAAVHLRKGKWPDDFLDAFQSHSPTRINTPKSSILDEDDSLISSSPISISSPRKLAIVGATRRNESPESLPQFPRRPTHRTRESVDNSSLAPRESLDGRDSSPGGTSLSSGRVVLRRHSTKPGMTNKAGSLSPRSDIDESQNSDSGFSVPFPKTALGGHSESPPSGGNLNGSTERPRVPRGRFRSDIDSSSARRRDRPDSSDELQAKPRRSRIESMVNLGADSRNASASDLLSSPRDSVDGSTVRRTLVVKEDGKPPTHFVSLGNLYNINPTD